VVVSTSAISQIEEEVTEDEVPAADAVESSEQSTEEDSAE